MSHPSPSPSPPSLLSLAIHSALLNISRFSDLSPLPDPVLLELFEVLRGDGGTPITDRESSCVGVRDDLRDLQGHSKRGGYRLSSEESDRGSRRLVREEEREEESGFRPSALRGGDGKYYAVANVQQRVFHPRGGEEGTVRSKDANMM
ncbi:hypothetical protein Scep_010793 [Stephania cephalantha]|uniref:Uncharacterized protein n=1 Tax=Stephania cephalantha TaxID=152367 RepID=A0AAP0PEJ3_9MAGN